MRAVATEMIRARTRSVFPSAASTPIDAILLPVCKIMCTGLAIRRPCLVVLRDVEGRGANRPSAGPHLVDSQLRAAHEQRPDPGLVVGEHPRGVMRIERPLVAPLLHDHEMAGVVERLGEREVLAAVLLASTSLRGTHQLSDLLTAQDLGVDVADRDDHRTFTTAATVPRRGASALAAASVLLPIALNGVWIAGHGVGGVLAGVPQRASLAQ